MFYFHPSKTVNIHFPNSCVTMARFHTTLSALCLFLVRATISITVNLDDLGIHQLFHLVLLIKYHEYR